MSTKSPYTILILISGSGTNLQAIIDATKTGILNCTIKAVISNKATAKGLERAKEANIPTTTLIFDKTKQTREQYDNVLTKLLTSEHYNADLLVLAGWMHILSASTLKAVHPTPIINLHPALYDTFVGTNAIHQTYESYQKSPETTRAGLMVHYVVPDVDKGAPILQQEVPLYQTDTEETLCSRIKYYEKPLLLQAITKVLNEIATNTSHTTNNQNIKHGKVRDYWDTGYNVMAMYQTDRQSGFDRNICTIPNKGLNLTKLSEYWFKITKHIVPNHYLYSEGQLSLVRKATVFPVEIVVRAFMTGSTATSLWTKYKHHIIDNKETEFNYCGHTFRAGYKKNQPLDKLYITPTTKGEHDTLITPNEIIDQKLMTKAEWNYVATKALELFAFGQLVALDKGYILVDTKYEFGRDVQTNEIMLVDELHTCDSSRYWRKESYQTLQNDNKEPEKLDKDLVRDFIKSKCDPYDLSTPLPTVPTHMIESVSKTYTKFVNDFLPPSPTTTPTTTPSTTKPEPNKIINNYFIQKHSQIVVIITDLKYDSTTNVPFIDNICKELNARQIVSLTFVASPHKDPGAFFKMLKSLNASPRQIAIVTVESNSNVLTSLCGAQSVHPVYTIVSPPTSPQQLPKASPVSLVAEPSKFAEQIEKCFRQMSRALFH